MMRGVVIAIVAVVVLYLLSVRLLSPNVERLIPQHDKDELLREADTGDLIFLAGSTFGERTIKLWTSSYYSHVGIVVREDGIPYILEADYGSGHRDGVRMITLADKLTRYKGLRVGGWRRWRGDRPRVDDIMAFAEKYIDYEVDPSMMCWVASSNPDGPLYRLLRSPGAKHVFCSELVVMCLSKLGVAFDHAPTWYSPQRLAELPLRHEDLVTFGVR